MKRITQGAALLAFGVFSFCLGGAVFGGSPEQPAHVAPSTVIYTPQPAQTVTVTNTVTVPTVPSECTAVMDRLMTMQEPLIAVIDSTGAQIAISNAAYVAITGKDPAALSAAQTRQYDLRRQLASAQAELLKHNSELTLLIEQCDTKLGR